MVDRWPKRNVMVVADVGRAVLAGVLALSHGSVGLAYGVAFGLSTGSLLFNPAASSLVPETVEADELVEANAGLWSVAVVAQILLAPTAGLVIAAFGVGLLVVLAGDWLDVGPSGFGALLGAIGLGAAGGPLLLRRHIRPGHAGWLFGPYALRGGVDLLLAAVASPVVAGGALLLYGVGTSTGMVAYQSTLQTAVPSAVRGRAFAFYDVTWNAARLVSLGLGGLLAEAVGIRAVYVVGGVLLLAAAGVGLQSTVRRPNSSALRSSNSS
ncbi:MAG TPA: MFS transporter [Acidimicrobiales bacterium]|nr:MFS transporter [Acidimicrobiales bacterium]